LRHISGVPRPESSAERELRLWPRVASRVERLRFRRAPLLAATICFAVGEAATKLPSGASRPTILLVFATVAFATLTLVALRGTLRIAVLPLAALWIAVGLWAAQIEPAPSPQTALLTYADNLSRAVQARVVRIRTLPAQPAENLDPPNWTDEPEDALRDHATPSTSLDLDLTSIERITPDISTMIPIEGGIPEKRGARRAAPDLHHGAGRGIHRVSPGRVLPVRPGGEQFLRRRGEWGEGHYAGGVGAGVWAAAEHIGDGAVRSEVRGGEENLTPIGAKRHRFYLFWGEKAVSRAISRELVSYERLVLPLMAMGPAMNGATRVYRRGMRRGWRVLAVMVRRLRVMGRSKRRGPQLPGLR